MWFKLEKMETAEGDLCVMCGIQEDIVRTDVFKRTHTRSWNNLLGNLLPAFLLTNVLFIL